MSQGNLPGCALVALWGGLSLAAVSDAADTGLKTGTVVSASAAWGGTFTTGNLASSDDLRAVSTGAGFGVLSTFGFGVPGGVTVSGIEVLVEGSDGTAAQTVNFRVDLSWNGGTSWTSWDPGPTFTDTPDATRLVGGGSLFGRAWTPAELSDANFRLRIERNGGTGNLRIDRLQIRVSYFTTPWPAGTMQVRTGTYVGSGANGRAITGVGFQPDVVLIIADSTCNGLPGQSFPCGRDSVIRTSTMGAADVSGAGYGIATAMQNRVQSLDADGFTVGEPPDHDPPNDDNTNPYHCANHSGTRYYWTALKAAAGEMELGVYVGDGAVSRDITGLSFQPDYVLLTSAEGVRILHHSAPMPTDYSFDIEGGAYCPVGCPFLSAIRDVLANGFRVGDEGNLNLTTFHYVAWKATSGRMAVGQYTGTGADNRSITGVGFRPEYVSVSQGTPIPPSSSTTVKVGAMGATTDLSYPHISYAAASSTNAIQALESGGFQVGTAANVNSLGNTFYWVAFGPGSAPLRVLSGSYIGDGVDNRAIYTGFAPDLVIVKRDENTRFAVARTSTMSGDLTKFLDVTGTAVFAGGIKSLGASGFTLGTDPNVNAVGASYYWVAFEGSAGEMTVGNYLGDDLDDRSIPGVGFQPDYVWVLSEGGFPPAHRSSSMAGDISYDFDAVQTTNRIQLLQADGFQVGSSPDVNKAGVLNHYVAFRIVPGRVAVGSYVGTGVDNRNLNVAGFMPEWALVKRSGSLGGWVQKPASTGINADYSIFFNDTVGQTNDIQQLRPLGFQVGFGGEATDRTNESGITYHYVAFGPHVETYFRSIGTAANYITGTVSVTKGSTVVTGAGTAWQTANRGRGDRIRISGVDYVVAWVDSNTQLRLTTPYFGATTSGLGYTLARQFTTLDSWEDCVSFGAACPFFPVSSTSLVADGRREVGIAYDDSVFALSAQVTIAGATTDALHDITLTADGPNRHNGSPSTGVLLDGQNLAATTIHIENSYVTVEWLEFVRFTGADNHAGLALGSSGGGEVGMVAQNLLVHNFADATFGPSGIRLRGGAGKSAVIRNTMIWDGDDFGIEGDEIGDTLVIENCSVDGMPGTGIFAADSALTIRNTIVTGSGVGFGAGGSGSLGGSNNTSSDGTAPGSNPQTLVTSASVFETPNVNLHLKSGANVAVDTGLNLSTSFWNDIDGGLRPPAGSWDRGADERGVATAVDLVAFEAMGMDGAVGLTWQTASELSNLGFHVYRARSADGPYERVTSSAIPGLGSSPSGASYRYTDSDLENGRTYFYKLEDIETTGRTTLHGPVSATPIAGAGSSSSAPELTVGQPSTSLLRVLERNERGMVLELRTEGFTAELQPDGTARLSIPGFTDEGEPGSPAVPVKRSWVGIESGRGVRVTSVRAEEVERYSSLRPMASESPEIVASPRGTVRAGRRSQDEGAGFAGAGLYPERAARVLQVGYQGEEKKAFLELSPLRWNRTTGELLLSRRLVVRLSFTGREAAERRPQGSRAVVRRLRTRERGLYGVSFEEIFGGRRISSVRLSRLGESVPYHIAPEGTGFGPGTTLYFVSEGSSLNPYGNEAVYELELSANGTSMPVVASSPSGGSVSTYWREVVREENRYYQAGLVNAEELWFWDVLLAPVTKSYGFEASELASASEPAFLHLRIRGTSDLPESPDHHVRVAVNGTNVAETTFEGTSGVELEAEIPEGVLREGVNEVSIENVGDTGAAYSMVMLDRFTVTYPRGVVLEDGTLEGTFGESGVLEAGGAFVVDVTADLPRWVTGVSVEAGRRYLVVSPESVRKPVVETLATSSLRSSRNRADYLIVGPKAFAEAARPLLELRRSQGLRSRFVSMEEVDSEFGFGESRPEAVKDFLRYANMSWQKPAPRYVLLLGDGSYDFKDYLKTGVKNQVPPLMVRTSYLWTASDPSFAAVKGEDPLPDLAIGRLPAASVEQARAMVAKILRYESAGAISRGPVVLVADNPDGAGDFEANAEALAGGVLSSRDPGKIYLGRLGREATRAAIAQAFDEGASLMSYVGHGGIHLWASENVLDTASVSSLAPQEQQPFVLTLNCLNGYFHFPYFDSLAEALVKEKDKGAVAAFSPSGLSLNEPAQLFHRALVEELLSGRHRRLGDAVRSAQEAYADSGAFPELLRIYHLLGDPALTLH